MSNTRYKVGETTYDIPENKVDSFLQAKPNAVLVNEGKQNASQTPDATVEQNTTASELENTSLDTDPTEVKTVVELPEVEPVFFKDIEITTDQVRQDVKWSFHELGVIGNLNKKYEALLSKDKTIVNVNGKEVPNPEYLEFTRSDLDFGGGKSIYIRSNQLTSLQKEDIVKFMPEGFGKGDFFGTVEESGLIKIKLPKASASKEEWDKATAAMNEVIKLHYEGVKSAGSAPQKGSSTYLPEKNKADIISSTLEYETENIKLREQIKYAVGEEKERLEEALKYNEENKDELVDYYKNYDKAFENHKYNKGQVKDNLAEVERIRKEANRRYNDMVGTEYQLSKFEVGTYQESGREQYVDSALNVYASNLSPNQLDKVNKTLVDEKAVEQLITETDIYGPTFGMDYEASGEQIDVSFLNDEQKIKLLRGLNGREIAQLAKGDFSVAMKEQQLNTSLWSLLDESRSQINEEFEDASGQAKELTQLKRDIDLESQNIQELSNSINSEFEILNSQMEDVQSILEGDTDKLAKLNGTIEQMKANPSGYTDEQKQNAIDEFNRTLANVNDAQGELNTLSDQYESIEERNSNLQSRSDGINSKINQFNSEQEDYLKELEKLNKRESALASTYGFTISGEVIGNRFEITDKYQEWKNKNVSGTNSDGTPFNSGFFGSARDLGNRIAQGLAIEVVDLYVGTGVWGTNLLGSFMKGATGIGSYSDSDQVYDRYDQLNAMYKNYVSDASFLAVADSLEGSAFSSYKHSMQTIGNMLPFTLALIGSMRKGNFSNTQAIYKQLSKKGFSKRKLEVFKTTEIGFRLTAIDQYQEAKDLGLNDDQALGYSTFTGLAIGLSNSVFSGEFGFGKQQAVREIFKTFSGSLKQAATKQAINKTIKEATVNLFQEFGEEEIELILSDVAKHSFGLSHAAEFTNFETHQQIVEGTILLSGTLKGVGGGSVQDFKRFKSEVYNGFKQRSGEVIEDINSQIAAIDTKIDQQKNPQYIGPKSADLLEQMKNELIQARDYGMLIQNAINLSPENVTNEQLDLIIQKNELLATKKDTDPAFHAMFDEEINKLNEQIQNSDVTSVARQNFERTVSNTEKIINAINPSLGNRKIQFKSFDGENSTQDMYDFLVGETGLDLETAEETIGSHGGAFVADGVEYIIVNKPVSLSSTGANVAAHELLHKMMFMSMAERDSKGNLITDENNQPVINKETAMALAQGLGSYIMGIDATKVENSIFASRLRAYQQAPASVQAQEVLTLFSDALATGDIKFEEGIFEKIGKFLEKAYQAIGLPISTGDSKNPGVKLKTGKDVFNFLKGFNESIKKGSLTADQKAMFLEGATIEGELADLKVDEDIIEASTAERKEEGSIILSSKEQVYQRVEAMKDRLVKADTKEVTAIEIAYELQNEIERRMQFLEGVDISEIALEFMTSDSNRGLQAILKKYDPNRNDSVMGYLNGFVPGTGRSLMDVRLQEFYENDPRYANIIQSTSEEAVGRKVENRITEETVEQQPERKTKLKVLADQLNVSKQVDGAVANADVDVTSIFNFKSVPNAAAGTVGELMGISPAKIKSKANLTKSELANAQRFIKKNVGVLIGMMPEGFDSSGKATGVPKTMLDAFYTKRESRAKTKAGLQTQVKRGNIKDSEFLEIFNIFEGIPDRSDRNTSARVIALANLMGKVMTNQSIRKQNPSVVSIADGMSKIMFSKEIDLNKTKDIDKTIEWGTQGGFALQPKSYWMKGLHGSGAKNTNIEEDGEQVYLDENNNKTFKKTKTKLKRYPLKTGGSILNNDPNFSESTINHVPASKGIFANAPQRDAILNKYEEDGGKFLPASETYQAASDRTTVYGKKTGEQVKALINKNQDKFNKSEKGFIDYWLNIQEDIENNPKNEKYWAALLEVTSTNQSSFMRVGSRLIGYNTLGLENREEHMSPASDFAKYLFQMAKDGLLTRRQMKQAMKSYTQISLPLIYDEMLKGVDVDGKPFDYTKVLPKEFAGLPVKLQILQGMIPNWVRYINPNVNAMPYTLNGKQYYGMNPNVLMLGDGRNLAQTYGLGVDSSLEMNQDVISVQQELLFKVFMNNITKAEAVSELNNYVNSMIPAASTIAMFSKNIDANKANVNPNGITILDFDDTLATTKSNILYTAPDGTKGKLNAEEFAKKGADLLGQGYVYDFSEFNKVVRGKTAPLFNKALKLAGKFGTDNMFVLTARPAEAALAISQFLKANGLDIPLKNITGLGNSTAEAKALWVAGKFSEGYNDFYFADDAIQNVKAVDNILEQFDVKRKVQQAKINFSKDLDPKFNQMLERSAGIGAQKIFSRVEAAKRGKNKGRFTFFVPPSAEDFTGLLRYFAGTGKQGDADIQFFNEALIKPFARADRAMGQMKQAIRDDYSALRKKFPDVKKKLGKLIEGTTFTNDMAVRAYLFDKAGYEVPGLSKQGKAKLINTVKGDPEMRAFADALGIISKQKDGYLKPSEHWNTENIALDLQNATNKVGRKQFLQEWVQNKEIVFSPENMNKIEAVYGTQFKEALEDVLFRMENGTNRSSGKTYGQGWTNWVNNSVGAIMFFNARSAVLQTLSTVNFINFEDNNIFAAGKAFANQKQYWADFSFLFNSDFLKNRRAGLATNVNEAELASAVAGATNKARAALGYLLKIGFTPTQIADSFAIASGGATYYRNKIKTYLKSGLSQEQAETRAMLDFQEIAEETQQSARPDRISQQQASPLGRIILAFANTPMQYNRLIKKAAGDLVNKRGDWRSNVSRILYYGAIQNFIFASLQNALFALTFDDDDEELTESQQAARDKKEETKNFRILNSMFDSLARGSGIYGAALATVKNAIFEFYEQEDKGYRADYNQVVIELLNVSPTIGSKVRKLASSGYTRKSKKDVMQEMSMLDYDNPAWQAIGNVVEATTNIPMARAIRKADNLREAYNQENSAMQRTFLGLGWSAWDLDVGTEVVKNEGKKNEYVIRLDTKRMNQEKVREKQKENVKKEKKASKQRCTGLTSNMSRCKNMVVKPKTRCHFHD